MAHCVHLEDNELELLADRGTSIAHCPSSNNNLRSGFCDVKRAIQFGVKVGLGTDVGAGSKSSILCAIVDALHVSHGLNFAKNYTIKGTGTLPECATNRTYMPLNYKQGIYLATLGGAEALAVDHLVGNFVDGKDFDALLVDVNAGPIVKYMETEMTHKKSAEKKLLELVQQFVYVGDDRNILSVYVQGKQVKV